MSESDSASRVASSSASSLPYTLPQLSDLSATPRIPAILSALHSTYHHPQSTSSGARPTSSIPSSRPARETREKQETPSTNTASILAPSSTKWDSRQQSFISPTKLQEFRATTPTHHFTSTPPLENTNIINTPTMMAPNSDQAHPRPLRGGSGNSGSSAPPGQTHSRTSSFFSSMTFNRNKDKDKERGDRASSADLPMQKPPESESGLFRAQSNQQQPVQPEFQAPPSNPPPTSGAPPSSAPLQPPSLHPEIRSIVSLTVAHAHKIYFSGPLIRRVEREPNGSKAAKDMGWEEVWAQLGGTTLSIWNMKEIQEASKQGREVPPSYINTTDAFVQVLGSVTVPAQPPRPAVPAKPGKPATATSPAVPPTPAQPAQPAVAAQRYTNVLTLNTAGSNLILFACPSTAALISWASALRLSSWEKSRLEEIYTAHLCRITLSARDIPTTLVRNRLEGWVRIRVAGQTDWKLVWMVVSAAASDPAANPAANGGHDVAGGGPTDELGRVVSNGNGVGSPPPSASLGGFTKGKKRMSSLFSREAHDTNGNAGGPTKPMVAMYTSPKPKDKKRPLMVLSSVSQVFAVYPERPELISRSTLFKVEGTFSSDPAHVHPSAKEGDLAGSMRGREGWVLIMPQLEGGLSQAAEMLKWVIAFHDAFHLYGRPQAWTWDPRDPESLMFAYPVGPHKDLLFLDREQAETLDPRDDRTSSIRSKLIDVLATKMEEMGPPGSAGLPGRDRGPAHGTQTSSSSTPPSLPPISPNSGPQLPPLSFDSNPNVRNEDRALLTPITERSSVYTRDGASIMLGTGVRNSVHGGPSPVLEEQEREFSSSPVTPTERNMEQSPKVPEKDHSSLRSNTSTSRRSAGGSPPTGGRASFDSFSNAVNTALPSSKPMSPVSGTASITTHSTSHSGGKGASVGGGGDVSTSPGTGLSSGTPPPPMFSPIRSHSPQSVLTSPHSVDLDHAPGAQAFGGLGAGGGGRGSPGRLAGDRNSVLSTGFGADRASVLTSPYSPMGSPATSIRALNSPPQSAGLDDSAGALYYMSQFDQPTTPTTPTAASGARRIPTTIQEAEPNGESEEGEGAYLANQAGFEDELRKRYEAAMTGTPTITPDPASPVVRKGTPMAFVSDGVPPSSPGVASPGSPLRSPPSSSPNLSRLGPPLGRKPSGARAPARHGGLTSGPDGYGHANSNYGVPGGYNTATTTNQFSSFDAHHDHVAPGPESNNSLDEVEEEELDDDDDLGSSIAPSHEQQPDKIPPRLRQQSSSTSSAVASPMASSPQIQHQQAPSSASHSGGLHAADDDVLAVLSYLDVNDSEEPSTPATARPSNNKAASSPVEPLHPRSNAGVTSAAEPLSPDPYTAASSSHISAPNAQIAPQYKSSFAPSKHAAERKAKAQAAQAAQAAAAHRPGARSEGAGGRRGKDQRKMRAVPNANAWNESDSEEEEDDDDDEVDSDEQPSAKAKSSNNHSSGSGRQGSENGHAPGMEAHMGAAHGGQGQQYSGLRPPRTLPQPPGRMEGGDEYPAPALRRPDQNQYSPQLQQQPSRGTYFDDQQIRSSQYNLAAPTATPGVPRQSMWSQVLDPSHTPGAVPENPTSAQATGRGGNELFVQLEPAGSQMTKAFTPQGLLSAGMADRQDRSAKRQEELARESGASLINVPNKPPPPQTGLLGAITAHERERKREGGVGAALTERERERRLAEERQRRWDEQQRMQMEQGGAAGMSGPMSMYGGMGGMGMNPMMSMYGMNPMMMGGMNPMMTGGMNPMMMGGMNPMMTGGMNPMMPMMTGGGMGGGYNPQHMFAAQQAAQAYQQAMMAFSVAGSQAGDDNNPGNKSSPAATPGGGMNPMMSGNFDPRMSMMSMGMGQGMGMAGTGGTGGGMGGGMMGPQMSGGGSPTSQFDPRFSPSHMPAGNPMNDSGLVPPSALGVGTNSPVRKGSPLAKSSSRPSTPKGS
ncbi:hypothetical protein GYMLUDRAFT_41206 [Collybiopsis luxurians FD-317 M1]|uniref:Skg3/CAF120-like PH-like domain-containing protein n=1 Tax=Collybiopsis luxurians FD-317 M1 TaxID=944289 RepID=A0A0D0D1D9_9AGAR|nr:hypothetical protein GYMLUDRAFT_41206 [Collybiopsis luxurians FD-317 M1]